MLYGGPPAAPTRRRRPRIEAMLGVTSLTIVRAGQGSGKTTTVAAWAASTGLPAVWVEARHAETAGSLDLRVLTGLRAIGLLSPEDEPSAGHDPKPTMLRVLSRLPSPLLIVIDGITDVGPVDDRSAWLTDLVTRLRRFPRVRLVLVGRSVPSVAGSLEVLESITTVTADDLAYTWEEVSDALGSERISASPGFTSWLHGATGGIPVLVHIVASALAGQRTTERLTPAQSALVANTVEEAVLGPETRALDPARLTVLRAASLLIDVSAAEVTTVAGVSEDPAREALDEAARRGWGSWTDGAHDLFSFEPVIARALAFRLVAGPATTPLARAAGLLSERGEALRALMMAFDVKDDDLILGTASRHGGALSPHHQEILVRLEEIPHSRVVARPLLAAAIAFCHSLNPHARVAMLSSYARAEMLARRGAVGGRARDRVVLQIVRSTAFLLAGRHAWAHRAALSGVELLESLSASEIDRLLLSPAVVYGQAATTSMARGDVRAAREYSVRAVAAQKASALIRNHEIVKAALFAAVDGDIAAARSHLAAAERRPTWDNTYLRSLLTVVEAIVDIESGRYGSVASDSGTGLREAMLGPTLPTATAARAAASLIDGDAVGAASLIRSMLADGDTASLSASEGRTLRSLLTIALFAAGNVRQARQTLRSLGDGGWSPLLRALDGVVGDDALAALLAASTGLSVPRSIRVRTALLLLRSVAALRLGRMIAAGRDARTAVTSLRDLGLRTPWYLVPDRDREAVLELVADIAPPGSSLAEELRSYPSLQGRSDPGSGRHVPRLTGRERAVLEGVFARETNAQMAARLGVSPNTVKKQRASLYTKLGVNSWEAAVHVAVDHGLLDLAD